MIKIKDFTENTFREATEKANEFIEMIDKEYNGRCIIIRISHEVTQTLLPPSTPNLGPRLVTKHYIMVVYDTWKNHRRDEVDEEEEGEVYGDY